MQTGKLIIGCYPGTHKKQPNIIFKQDHPEQYHITLKAHMKKNNQKTIHRKVDRNTYKEQ